MIADALDFIKEELQTYLNNVAPKPTIIVRLNNVANLEAESTHLDDRVLISLVNVEEESAYKNIPGYRTDSFTGNVSYRNPAVFLNLYVLFSCTASISPDGTNYFNALNSLGWVVQFFQSKRFFTIKNALSTKITSSPNQFNDFKLILDLYTLTFEQINHLWGSLGGKQVPFVMYKIRLVKIEDGQVHKGGDVITEIQSREEILAKA